MIRATLVIFRLACVAGLYWFLYRVCACVVSDAGASRVALANEWKRQKRILTARSGRGWGEGLGVCVRDRRRAGQRAQ